MNERPPGQDEPDDVDELYRRASALDPDGPSEEVRRSVLAHAARLAAERTANAGYAKARPARRSWRRPALFGTLAAAAIAGLMVVPRLLPPGAPVSTLNAVTVTSPSAESAPAPAAPPSESRQMVTVTGERRSAPAAPPPPATAGSGAAARNAATPVPSTAAKSSAADAAAPSQVQASAAAETNAPRAPSGALSGALSMRDEAYLRRAPRVDSQGSSAAVEPQRGTPAQPATAAQQELRAESPDSALRRAAENGDTATLQTLLRGQVDTESPDAGGRTALMLATLSGHADVVDALLAHGANPNAADASGTTPLQAALAANHPTIVAALRAKGAR